MDPTRPIPFAAILAGGRAVRMGTDKAVIRLGGVPMIEWVWTRISAVAERGFVVGGPPRLDHLDAPTTPDLHPGAGALGGIATTLQRAREEAGTDTWALCVGCDMPFLEPKLLLRLWELRAGWDAVVPQLAAGFEPLCALYSSRCLPAIAVQLRSGTRRIRDLFREVPTRAVSTVELRSEDPELRSFVNVNSPHDLSVAERAIRGAA